MAVISQLQPIDTDQQAVQHLHRCHPGYPARAWAMAERATGFDPGCSRRELNKWLRSDGAKRFLRELHIACHLLYEGNHTHESPGDPSCTSS